MAELDGIGVATVFAADAELDAGAGLISLRRRNLDELADAGLVQADIDWLVPHQANARILDATARKLSLSPDKVVTTVAQHANTSAASVPLALDVAMRDGRLQPGVASRGGGGGGGGRGGGIVDGLKKGMG